MVLVSFFSLLLVCLNLDGNVFALDLANWMRGVDGNTKLSDIAIPGTHDSGSFRTPGDIGETQDWSVNQQMYNGIRFLDIRIANNYRSNDFEIRHGKLKLGSFNGLVMNMVDGFLRSHPTETILMSIRDEARLDIRRLERDYILSNRHRFYRRGVGPTTKLKDVRGKIVLFKRYRSNNAVGMNWGAISNIQDEYNLGVECKKVLFVRTCGWWVGLDYPKKARIVAKNLQLARTRYGGNQFFVNFASANYKGAYIGNSAKVSNAAVRRFFNTIAGRVGVIVPMDYPNRTPGVVKAMIKNSLIRHPLSMLRSARTDGFWGSWGTKGICPANQYVYGYRLRSEGDQHSGDDTALNAIELRCAAKGRSGGPYTKIFSKYATWGTWSSWLYCPGSDNPVTGFNMRMEGKQGSGDDTAANDVDLYCRRGGHISATVKTSYGSITPVQRCPGGQAVVGIITRVESNQGGSGDDTALNGVRLFCKKY